MSFLAYLVLTVVVLGMAPLPIAAAYPALPFEAVPCLRLVYERDGAPVYEITAPVTQATAEEVLVYP